MHSMLTRTSCVRTPYSLSDPRRARTPLCHCSNSIVQRPTRCQLQSSCFNSGLTRRLGRSTQLHSLADTVGSPVTQEELKTEPTAEALEIWRKAQAVCFDVDCTVCVNDSLDLLAEFMGVGEAVAQLTNKAMNGTMSLEEAITERLRIINCTPHDIQRFLKAYPAETRLVPGIKELISTLQARGKAVYLISGGFRELCLPIAKAVGVPYERLYANRMNWQVDDETGLPTKLVGFDERELTGHGMGKPRVIEQLRSMHPYETVVMVGDGITDLEAVQMTGGADLFIGFGGVVAREAVYKEADWFVTQYSDLLASLKRYKVAVIGSGAWACAATKLISRNVLEDDPADEFDDIVNMWVYEEDYEDGKLTEAMNRLHENPKYLPGVHFGENVVAVPELEAAVKGADLLVICVPHQFVHRIAKQLKGLVSEDALAISLTKGMRVRADGPQLISELVRKTLRIECGVLMGANIAKDIGEEQLSEATIGYRTRDGELFQKLFQTPYFYTSLTPDVVGTEMCGTLKNIVALAVGMVQGLGYGPNTEAAIMRAGLNEMRLFSKALYPDVRDETFFESCGVADLVASSYGGRNRRVAAEYTKRYLEGQHSTFDELEAELLKGQKLQGVLTSDEVQEIIMRNNWQAQYPLFTTINHVVNYRLGPEAIVRYRAAWNEVSLGGSGSAVQSADPIGLTSILDDTPAPTQGSNGARAQATMAA